ncbi:hypothetical protein C364_04834 [Cryptococcus neoformans Bt63]|nr:hypothetical protein C364_04834 [Cryptococcus neoformans var. grubii Bt63]
MAPTSRSKVSTKGRPQSKVRKKTAAQPPRLLTPRPPLSRTTSSESMGEQIEVQLECHSTPEAHPSPGESSVGSHPPSPALSHVSYVSHADLSVHSPLSNHSSPSHAHNEGRPSPTGSGSVYEPSQEPPEGYTDINNAALKKVLDAHITPFTQLPETARAELMGSTCPDTVDVDSWAIAMSPEYYQQHFCNVHTIATLCSYLAVRPRDSAEYEGWTALAASGHVIFIHPSYSKSFIEHMGQHRPIEPAKTDFCITTSSLVVPMLDVIECLKEISCPTLRLVCHGQKRRITDYTVPFEPNVWKLQSRYHFAKICMGRESLFFSNRSPPLKPVRSGNFLSPIDPSRFALSTGAMHGCIA